MRRWELASCTCRRFACARRKSAASFLKFEDIFCGFSSFNIVSAREKCTSKQRRMQKVEEKWCLEWIQLSASGDPLRRQDVSIKNSISRRQDDLVELMDVAARLCQQLLTLWETQNCVDSKLNISSLFLITLSHQVSSRCVVLLYLFDEFSR